MIRVAPIFKKPDEYYDGTVHTDEDRKSEIKLNKGIARNGIDRAFKKAYIANNIFSEIKSSILDSLRVVPKVLSLFCRKNYYSNAFCSLVYVYNVLDNIKDM